MIPMNFSWLIPQRLAGLGRPLSREHIEFLADVGVRHLVCLTEVTPCLHGVELVRLHHIPVTDMTPPSVLQVQEFLRIAQTAIERGESVAVHCARGMGRTGTMLACYLVKTTACSAQEAIDMVRQSRPGSIETIEQEHLVRQVDKLLNRHHES